MYVFVFILTMLKDIEVYGDVYYWSQESGHVYITSEDGTTRMIDHISEVAALAYDPLAHTLYCSSPKNNRVNTISIVLVTEFLLMVGKENK